MTLVPIAIIGFLACAWAAPQKIEYQLPSGSVSYVRNQNEPVKLQKQLTTPYNQHLVNYVQPTVNYVQPAQVSHVHQPRTHIQPAVNYAQPTAGYVQSTASYVQPTVSYVQPQVNHFKDFRANVQPQIVPSHDLRAHVQPPVNNFQQNQAYFHNQQSHLQQFPISRQDNFANKPIAIVRLLQENNIDGTFNYDFEGENGIKAEARGLLKNVPGSDQPGQVMSGSYSYIAPDGTPITTNWYADETGFHAEGNHLPVPPPIPVEIQRSLEYLRSLPPNPEDLKYN